MNPFASANNDGNYWWQNKADYKDIEHKSTVVTCNNKFEMAFVLEWLKNKNAAIPKTMIENEKFPIHLSVYGFTPGFTFSNNRALYYMPFLEFYEKLKVETNEAN